MVSLPTHICIARPQWVKKVTYNLQCQCGWVLPDKRVSFIYCQTYDYNIFAFSKKPSWPNNSSPIKAKYIIVTTPQCHGFSSHRNIYVLFISLCAYILKKTLNHDLLIFCGRFQWCYRWIPPFPTTTTTTTTAYQLHGFDVRLMFYTLLCNCRALYNIAILYIRSLNTTLFISRANFSPSNSQKSPHNSPGKRER